MKWQNFEHQGNTYELSHLHPFECSFPHPSKDGSECKVNIIFSMHCFTRSSKGESIKDESLAYSDTRETRVFDFYRHELSFHLPAAIKNLKKCFRTGQGNFFTIELINNEGTSVEYEIFFDVRKVGRGNNGLELYVQSAYVRDVNHQSSRPKKRKIGLNVILNNRLKNQSIKP